ncbi:hypothetical protein MBLNU459_g5166t1 [Dothideomycetes sp. NU459]
MDSNPGSYSSVQASTFTACMAACDAASAQGCTVVSYVGTTCYLKTTFNSAFVSSNVNTAVLYVAPPPYPVPVSNYVNASTGCGTPLTPGIVPGGTSKFVNITAPDGNNRSYYIRVPALYDVNKASPLIMAFHGRGETGANMESESGFSTDAWNPYGIAVYPNGINLEWQSDPDVYENTHINDITFVNALLTNLSSTYCLDTGRLFASGFSNGGGFCGVAACDPGLSANCGSQVPYTVLTNNLVQTVCSPGRPNVPVMEIHGDNDGTISYFGGGRRDFCLPAMPHWTTDWAVRNNQSSANITTSLLGGNVTKYEWGWGHTWSSTAAGGPINITPNMVNFFYRFTNPNGPSFDYLAAQSAAAFQLHVQFQLPVQCSVQHHNDILHFHNIDHDVEHVLHNDHGIIYYFYYDNYTSLYDYFFNSYNCEYNHHVVRLFLSQQL